MSPSAVDLKPLSDYLNQFRQLVSSDLVELAFLQSTELTEDTVRGLHRVTFPSNFGLQISSEEARSVTTLLREAIEELAEPSREQLDELAADYAAIYLLHGYRASPCESVWFDEDGLIFQESMFEVREVMKHYGLQANDWRRRSEDHLAMQLLFVACIFESAGQGMCLESALRDAAKFLDEHTLRWVGQFASKVASRCFTKFYAGLVKLTELYLDQLRDDIAKILDQPRPNMAEINARYEAARRSTAAVTQSTCGPLCEPREDPKPNRRRYP